MADTEVWIHRRTGERVEVRRFYYVGAERRVVYLANGAAYNVAAARWEEAYRRASVTPTEPEATPVA